MVKPQKPNPQKPQKPQSQAGKQKKNNLNKYPPMMSPVLLEQPDLDLLAHFW